MNKSEFIYLEDLQVNETEWSGEITVDGDEMLAYNRRNDPWPIHVDEQAASKTSFGSIIASGGFTITLLYRLCHQIYNRPESPWAFMGGFNWEVKFPNPVKAGDRLRVVLTVLSKRESSKPDRGVFQLLHELVNQDDQTVLSLTATVLIGRRPAGPIEDDLT